MLHVVTQQPFVELHDGNKTFPQNCPRRWRNWPILNTVFSIWSPSLDARKEVDCTPSRREPIERYVDCCGCCFVGLLNRTASCWEKFLTLLKKVTRTLETTFQMSTKNTPGSKHWNSTSGRSSSGVKRRYFFEFWSKLLKLTNRRGRSNDPCGIPLIFHIPEFQWRLCDPSSNTSSVDSPSPPRDVGWPFEQEDVLQPSFPSRLPPKCLSGGLGLRLQSSAASSKLLK